MNTQLMHTFEYFRSHIHPAIAADSVQLRTSYVQKLFAFADRAGKIALVISMAAMAMGCFEKIAASVALTVHYCDFCAVLPVMLAVPW